MIISSQTKLNEQNETELEPLQPRNVALELSVQFWKVLSSSYTAAAHFLWMKQRHRTRLQLLDLTDDQLKDIGISRSAAQQEANKAFWEK